MFKIFFYEEWLLKHSISYAINILILYEPPNSNPNILLAT